MAEPWQCQEVCRAMAVQCQSAIGSVMAKPYSSAKEHHLVFQQEQCIVFEHKHCLVPEQESFLNKSDVLCSKNNNILLLSTNTFQS